MVQSASNQGCLDETERTLRGQELELTTRELPVFLRRHRVFVSAVAILLGIGLILGGIWDPLVLLDMGVGVNLVGLILMLAIAGRRPGRRRS